MTLRFAGITPKKDSSSSTMMIMMCRPLSVLCLLLASLCPTVSFSVFPRISCERRWSSRLGLLEEDGWIGQPTMEEDAVVDSSTCLYKSLQERQDELKRGIGKRFVVRTQKGFLNVHSSLEYGPFATDNIVCQLEDGQVVTSIDRIGAWVRHDQGGWSIARYGGFVFLQPLEE